MFECKSDVDRHVEFCLKRMQTESERNLRSFAFAKLYFNIGEYELSRRYVSSYLISKPKSAEAQLLLGKILEKLGRREAALEAYRTSLDIDPKQNGLVLKVCELLASNDVTLDATRARFWTEQAQLLDPQHPAVFNLRARLAAADSTGPDDVRQLFLSELEHRPTDVALRVRLLQHLLDNNQLTDAYHHVAEIESKDLTIFSDHLVWYETVATILVRFRNENTASNAVLTWEFWMLIVSVLDKLVALCLDENITTSKNLSECVKALFNLDQTLTIAAENINASCTEKQFAQEFLIHYRAQLCFHIAVLLFKQAKKDQIKYAEAVKLCIPLLLASYHSAPVELQCVWLEHAAEASRQRAAAWHRAAAHRCSQAGHVLLGLARERRSSFSDRAQQLMAGAWRERTIKNIFITRDQQLKIKTSYFVTCPQLDDIVSRLPDQTELLRYDEVAQLVHPGSLHHAIWIGLNNDPVNFRCSVFDGLQYSVRNLNNCAAETLNVLDIQAFLYCCIFCAQANIEESKHLIYYNSEKPAVLPAAITEPYGSLNQTKWYSSVYKMYKNEYGASLSDVRVTLLKGIEVVRCAGAHGLDAKLLVLLANTFAARAKKLTKSTEIEATEARADLYWRTALPLLEKLRNNQAISYPATRWFEYRAKEITPTELNMYIEEGKLFSAQQLMKKKEHEKALQLLSTLKNPYASFYQAQTYKLLSDEQMSHNKESVTSEMRSQHIILLSKARDCFYLTLDRLREPAVDRKHPLNAELGTEIEKIERLLSRIDPDTVNRNECDGMSDENLSSVGSVGETGGGYTMMHHTTYHNGTGMSSTGHGGLGPTTPRHEPHHSTLLGRREARPSPERLDAQLRQMAAAKDAAVAHILDQNRLVMDAHRTLVDEIRGFKDAVTGLTASVNELRDIKHSVDELKVAVDDLQNMKEAVEQVYEIKKDLAELKKDTNKLKSSQINEEDLYALEEEYGVDYNINTAGASGFNSAAALYPNLQQRFQNTAANTLAYGAPGLYPSLYPMYPYGGLSLGQPTALPFPDGHVPDFRAMQPPPAPLPTNLFAAKVPAPTDATGAYKFDNANLALNTVPAQLLQPTIPAVVPAPVPAPIIPQVPLNKAPPVNVVITASDPLPTTSAAQPVLSVTIPPQHLKGNQPPKVAHQPHNYQIPLPVTTQPTFSNVHSTITSTPMPVSTQNLLSNVAPPVYSSLTVKSPNQAPGATNKGLGLQIEKSLAQSFTTPNNSELNKSNASEGSVLEEHDPCPDFKPIIPLPDEVPVNTGEEGERVLFSLHAKLYRFVEREWRERGIGTVKLLHNEASAKVRVLMRRDQVHKICANHFLAPDMVLTPMQKNERAYIWAANDFADENVVLEKFCIRFKTPEEGKKFAEAFEHAKTLLKTETTKQHKTSTAAETKKPETPKDSPNSLGGFVFTSTPTFKPKTDVKTEAPAKQIFESVAAKPSPFASFTFGTPKSTPTSEFKPVQKLDIASTPKDSSLVSPKPVVKQQTSVSEEQEEDEDFVPTTEFKPVIPLPDLIEVKTGEENSEVLYEVKAKLLRFDSTAKEWKERGVGNIKILKDKTIRLLMRREQVHKVCCNHQLLKSMVFTNMPKNNRVLNWCAQDYAENVLKTEMFAIRFRTAELCEEFLQMIHKAQDMLDSSNNVSSGGSSGSSGGSFGSGSGDATSLGWGEKFKPKEGSWECSVCYVSNTDKYTCIACGSGREDDANSAQDNAQSPQKFKPSPPAPVFIDKSPKPKVGTWQCKVCFIHNDGKNHYCEACDSPKNDTVAKKDASVDLNASGPQFSFGSVTPNFGSPAAAPVSSTTSNWGDLFKPKVGAWECKACYISNDGSALYCIACESPKDDTVPKKENKGLDLGTGGSEQKFTFGIPSTTMPATNESIFGGKSQISAGFTFGMNQVSTSPATGFSFGIPSTETEAPPVSGFTFESVQKQTTPAASEPLNLVAPGKATFTFSLNKPTEVKPPQDEFIFGSPQKHDFEFKPRSPRKVSGSGDGEDSDGGEIEEECDNIYFKPVIPLPDKVEVRTGEEDEAVLYSHRSKLFRFTNGEWKERGIGDVKILKHPDNNKLRVLMRREQVHKICLNHCLSKDIEYKAKDDHTWLFTAPDYSDGEITYQQFCLRFKNAEIATQFINAVDKARNEGDSASAELASAPKTKVERSTSDPDLEIVYEVKVSPELQEKALKLQLPKNFYAYLEKEPCKGCIGCNDDNFKFSTTKPQTIESTIKISAVKSDTSIFASPGSTFFGTPKGSIFSGNNSTTSGFDTPKSTVTSTSSTFSFGSQSKSFSSPFSVTTTTSSTTNIFSTPTSQPTNIFGKSGSMIFGSTTITPIKNDAPTLTSLLTQSQPQPTSQASQPSEHKSPLAPSKLGTVLSTSTSMGSIFSGAPPAQPSGNIFGGKPSTPSTPPLSQMLSSNKTGPVFGSGGSTIFGGGKPETNIFSGTAVKTEATNIFGNFGSTTTTASIFGGTGSGSVFSTPSQPVFGNNFSFTQPDKPSIFGNLSNTPTFGSIAAQQNKDTEPVLKSDSNLTFAALASENQNQNFTATDIKGSIFGNVSNIPSFGSIAAQQNKDAEPVLKSDSNLTFAALASENQNQNFTAAETKGETKPFSFAGAGSLVFGGQKPKTENKTSSEKPTNKDKSITAAEGDEEDGAGGGDAEGDDNYDPHYEPIVPLPDAIVVKTGEEDETVLFNERAKLYRYTADTKEWKERGVGQLKLLYHPDHGTHRLLLRREQVHKLVLNQLVTADLDLQPMQTSDRAWCWAGYNHAEEGGVLEQLAVRFKNPELATLFKEMVSRALDELANKPPVTLTDASPHDTTGNEDDTHEDEDQDNDDDEQEDEYGSEDSDENRTIMFCKRCTLSYKSDEGGEWIIMGMGVIKMLYDSEMYGGRVEVMDDAGATLSNTIVAINTVMKVEDTSCIWRAMEWSLSSPVPRILRAQFSSAAAAEEMYYNYEEALQYAQHSEIVDNLPQ